MKLKYSPCKDNTRDTVIKYIGENTISIDGKQFVFDSVATDYTDMIKESDGMILEASIVEKVLCLTVLRFYTGDCTEWDTGKYSVFK